MVDTCTVRTSVLADGCVEGGVAMSVLKLMEAAEFFRQRLASRRSLGHYNWREHFLARGWAIERARTKRLRAELEGLRKQLAHEKKRAYAWSLAATKLGCTVVKLGDWEAD